MFIEHANLTVTNVDRSIDFYSKLFDFRTRWRGTTSDGLSAAHLGRDRFYLALFEAEAPGRAAVDYGQVGLNHIGFVIDDLDALKSRLHELGIRVHHEADYEPGRRAYFFDPDGIEVELVEYQAGREPWAYSEAGVSAAGAE